MPQITVHLVGAGPGDPGLLTCRGRALLARAEVVLFDGLVDPRLLELTPDGCERIAVGKPLQGERWSQDEIHAVLVERARTGRRVVRLKGGDPYVFGRGGEEGLALADAGIAFEVVPGVTAAQGAAAAAGIPLTQRGSATWFAAATGHTDPLGESGVPLEALARGDGTLVVYMGTRRLAAICERLRAAGLSEETPAALVERATTARQRVVTGTLATLPAAAEEAGIAPPALAMFGPTVALAGRLGGPAPRGRVLVTRSAAQAGPLCEALLARRIEPVPLPAIRAAPADPGPLDRALADLASVDWILFSSPNAVRFTMARLLAVADARALAGVRLGALGPGTARALGDYHLRADAVADRAVGEALADLVSAPCRALLPTADIALASTAEAVRAVGVEVVEVVAYRTLPAAPPPALEARLAALDLASFASPSAVRYLAESLGERWAALASVPCVCMGPRTAEAARRAGLTVAATADPHTLEGLVAAIDGALDGALDGASPSA